MGRSITPVIVNTPLEYARTRRVHSHRDLYLFNRYFRTKYLNWVYWSNFIWTSGIPMKIMDNARKAVEVTKDGFISVHLDTLDEKIYKKLHSGNPKLNIKSILKGVENVQQLGKDPNQMINCITFTKPLINDIENVTETSQKLELSIIDKEQTDAAWELKRIRQYVTTCRNEYKNRRDFIRRVK